MSEDTKDTEGAVTEQDEQFCAYFDDEMSEEMRVAFEARLDAEPDLAEEFEAFVEFMGGLQGIQIEQAPTDFVEHVEHTLRTRSRGRFYGEEMHFRMQTEIVAAIMLVVMATVYLFMGAPSDKNIGDHRVKGDRPALEQRDSPKE